LEQISPKAGHLFLLRLANRVPFVYFLIQQPFHWQKKNQKTKHSEQNPNPLKPDFETFDGESFGWDDDLLE